MKHKKGANTSQKILLGIFIILAIAALAMVFMQVSATGFAIFGTNNAAFMYQNVPTTMIPGTNYTITIIMNNTGTNPWATLGKYKLGSQSPQDNTNWGINRVELPASPINKGKAVSFTFSVKAPTTPGNYSFQWKMVQEGKGWFGTATPKLPIAVAPRSICGNNQCEAGETTTTCAADCACADSDGGYNYSLLGFSRGPAANGTVFTVADACRADGYSLDEAVCFGNTPGFTTYSCPYGCANGICKPNTPPPVVCGDGLCGTGEECEWNGTSQSQFMCPDNPTLPIGKVCSGCKLYNNNSIPGINGVYEDVPLGKTIAGTSDYQLDKGLDDGDIAGLLDTTIQFQAQNYDVSEHIQLAQQVDSPTVETSLTSFDYDYETDVALHVLRSSIKYYHVFDSRIAINNTVPTSTLKVDILGKPLEIARVNSPSSFTGIVGGTRYMFLVGETRIIQGKNVTLSNVSSNGGILVTVDGTPELLGVLETQLVNGVYLTNKEAYYNDQVSQRMAVVLEGQNAVQTFTDGDAYIGENQDNPNWVWNIGGLTTYAATTKSDTQEYSGPYIGVTNDFTLNSADDNSTRPGQCIDLPNNYANVCLEKLVPPNESYAHLEIEATTSGIDLSNAIPGYTNTGAIVIASNQNNMLGINISTLSIPNPGQPSSITTDTLYLHNKGNLGRIGVYYRDADNNIQLAGHIKNASSLPFLSINYYNTTYGNMNADLFTDDNFNSVNLTFKPNHYVNLPNTQDNLTLWFGFSANSSVLGASTGTEEANEIRWINNVSVGTIGHDLRTKYGVIIRNPELNGGNDKLVLDIPGDQIKAEVSVKKTTFAGSQ